MVDVVDVATRSRMMAGIRGKNTKPEICLRRLMHGHGFRYRLHDRNLPGHPDLVFPRYRAAVFVHGCFWHRHEGCRYTTMPATRPEFWTAKFEANIARDNRNESLLAEAGWRTAIVWECAIKRSVEEAAEQLSSWLKGNLPDPLEVQA